MEGITVERSRLRTGVPAAGAAGQATRVESVGDVR
jgi:hypothetical protein